MSNTTARPQAPFLHHLHWPCKVTVVAPQQLCSSLLFTFFLFSIFFFWSDQDDAQISQQTFQNEMAEYFTKASDPCRYRDVYVKPLKQMKVIVEIYLYFS